MNSLKSPAISDQYDLSGNLRIMIDQGNLELPILPDTASKLLRMCNSAQCPPKTLVDALRQDQSIAAHVLRIANSPIYCASSPIVSLQQAVARLGMSKIREIVLIVSCQGRAFEVDGFDDDVRASFRKSLGAAGFCQRIARALKANVEEAFLCGLLHDMGRPVLLQAIVDLQKQDNVEFDRAMVCDIVETLRAEVGSMLIKAWKLPERVANAVMCQLLTDPSEANQDARILNLAIKLTNVLCEEFDGEVAFQDVYSDTILEQLNLYPEQLDDIVLNYEDILGLMNSSL